MKNHAISHHLAQDTKLRNMSDFEQLKDFVSVHLFHKDHDKIGTRYLANLSIRNLCEEFHNEMNQNFFQITQWYHSVFSSSSLKENKFYHRFPSFMIPSLLNL